MQGDETSGACHERVACRGMVCIQRKLRSAPSDAFKEREGERERELCAPTREKCAPQTGVRAGFQHCCWRVDGESVCLLCSHNATRCSKITGRQVCTRTPPDKGIVRCFSRCTIHCQGRKTGLIIPTSKYESHQ